MKLFTGRINRRNYCLGLVSDYLAVIIFSLIVHNFIGSGLDAIIGILFDVLLLGSIVFAISLLIRRFHDFGKSGQYVWLLLVPFVNLYFAYCILLKPGETGKNAYGPQPSDKLNFPKEILGLD